MSVSAKLQSARNNATEVDGGDTILEEQGLSLVDFLRILRVRLRIVLGMAITVIVLTVIVTFQLTPLYTATAMVMLDERQNNVVDVEAVLSGLPMNPINLGNQIQILQSRVLAGRVIDRLGLDQDPEFNIILNREERLNLLSWINMPNWILNSFPALFEEPVSTLTEQQLAERRRDGVINRFIYRIEVRTAGLSSAINIHFTSVDGTKAARIANTIADEYVQDQLNAKFEATQRATVWLADRLQELAGDVQANEAAVAQYRAEYGVTDISVGQSVVTQQLSDLNGQLILSRIALAEQEATYNQVLYLQESGRTASASQVVASPLIRELRQQETLLLRHEADLSSRYGPRHPLIINLESEKRNLTEKITLEIERVIETVTNDTNVVRARVQSLERSLNELTRETNLENQARIRLRELETTAISARTLYETFLARFQETVGQEDIQTSDSRVISHAPVPGSPSFPNTILMFGVSVPGGLFLGFLLALLVERIDNGFRTSKQVENLLNLPVLATIPEISKSGDFTAELIIEKPLSSFAEAVRGLQMGIALSNVDQKPKVVLVTSAIPEEGKTNVTLSLARLAASSRQRVVIVDGDMRHPSLSKMLGASENQGDILEALKGDKPLDQCLCQDPHSTAVFISTLKKISNPPDILGSTAMTKLIAGLRSSFDLVVIDSAPLLPVHDTMILADLVDSVILAVRWEKTPREAVSKAVRILTDVQASIAGIVLTRADMGRYQYYNYGYQRYYSYKSYFTD